MAERFRAFFQRGGTDETAKDQTDGFGRAPKDTDARAQDSTRSTRTSQP